MIPLLILSLLVAPYPLDPDPAGYTLFSPTSSTETYLIDIEGDVVHSWSSSYEPGQAVYLLGVGSILRTARVAEGGGGAGGGVQRIAWDSTLLWEYVCSGGDTLQHHDIEPMPNGNVLILMWEYKTRAEAVAAGRDPALIRGTHITTEYILEVRPDGSSGGEIVWMWRLWDHLIQDFDSSKDNYGDVAAHPELVDLNFPQRRTDDWAHANSVDYNEELDQILISSRALHEIWIIDHSTTTEEAAGHEGGASGMGGDILYRWGNPMSYRAGGSEDRKFYGQHDAQWVEKGRPGEGDIIVFNNGVGRPEGDYSSIDEIIPPVDEYGTYYLEPGGAFGPEEPVWTYTADPPESLFADRISGTQRLRNGNTLICDGPSGRFLEVTPAGETAWEYLNLYPNPEQNSVFKVRRYDRSNRGTRNDEL